MSQGDLTRLACTFPPALIFRPFVEELPVPSSDPAVLT